MMKKALVVLVVLALASFGTMAFAADVTVNGSVDIRSRGFQDLDMDSKTHDGTVDTQERVRLEVNVKAGDVKGKVAIENDWDTWGRNEEAQGDNNAVSLANKANAGRNSFLDLREAWMLFPVPNTPVNIKAGHMLLQLGEGWFYRAMKYGSDAWVAFTDIDALHLGIVDVKVAENISSKNNDDTDFYVLVGTYKLNESTVAGLNITSVKGRPDTDIMNVGFHFGGKVGPAALKAELDVQSGKTKDGYTDTTTGATSDLKYSGNQIVLQAAVAMDPVTINATIARGSGNKITATDKNDAIVTALDADMHYTLLYEYKIAGACGGKNQGFCNTTAISAGAMFAATKNLSVGADVWVLQATEKVAPAVGDDTTDLGTEIDAKINWKLADNLSWNWNIGYFMPGKAYKYTNAAGDEVGKDAATGVQGVLSMKF
jgi:hypothetical protein